MANKVIFITGGSASGKSTLSQQIIDHFQNDAVLVSQDAFYKSTGSEKFNYDIPKSMDFEMMKDVIAKLKNNKAAEIPIYDFVKNDRIGQTIVQPKPIIIFEGLFTLHDYELSELADFKIFVDTPADTRLARRIIRDVKERGRTLDSVIKRWISDVQPSYEKYIGPTKKYVDVVIPWHKIKTRAIEALLITITHIGKNNQFGKNNQLKKDE